MNKLRKLTCLLLALMMAFAMTATASAADGTTYTITITNAQTGHIYEAYQIFAGDLLVKPDGTKILSNIVWGKGVKEAGRTALGDAAQKAESLTTEADAKTFAAAVAQYLQTPTNSDEGTTGRYTISGLAAGYYLVKDKDNTLNDADDFYTAYIMRVVGDVVAEPKGNKPTLTKEIKHNDDGNWGVVGDNQIGDIVKFRTITTVPDTTGYTTYTYKISDTMSAGLTSNVKSADDVTIKVNNENSKVLTADYYTVTATGNTFTIDVKILDAVKAGVLKNGDKLYANYSGVLNKDAKVYNENQYNEAYLEYSNNPNDEGIGKTPEKKVYDWTFKMGINKVDGNSNPLTGAKFVLSKSGAIKVADLSCGDDGVPTVFTDLIGLVKTGDNEYRIALNDETGIVYDIDAGNPVIKGLDDNVDYYLYETKSPEGYNLLSDPVSFKIAAEYNDDGSALRTNYPTVTVGTETSTELSTNVINKSGAELPSTGGMGTTLFYVLGGVLVLAAVVLLVTKKRMRSEN